MKIRNLYYKNNPESYKRLLVENRKYQRRNKEYFSLYNKKKLKAWREYGDEIFWNYFNTVIKPHIK